MLTNGLIVAGLIAALLLAKWLDVRRQRQPKKVADKLDTPMMAWGPNDNLTVRDLLNGGISIIGRAGSGKTSSSGRMIGTAVIQLPRSGGLILAAKPEDLEMWKAMFEKEGRKDDLLVFGPDQPLRFNLLSYVLSSGGNTRDVTKCVTTVGESLRSSDTKGGEDGSFWDREAERMIYNAVEMVRLATGSVSAPDIQRFINSAPMLPEQIQTEEWQAGYCNECIFGAFTKEKTRIEEHDFELAREYWLTEYPNMADKTRSSILVHVLGILHVFNTGVVRELVSTETNVSPDDMFNGKWVIVDMSPAEWGDTGALVSAGWKYLVEKAVLRRKTDDSSNVVVIWCDEAAQFVNSFDAHFITQCRSHKGCLVFLTQSLHSYYAALKGEGGKNQAEALLTNFSTRIFHAVGDAQTAEWAAKMLGKRREAMVSTSMNPSQDMYLELLGMQQVRTSAAEHYEMVLQENTFMHGLRTGGPPDFIADAIVIRSGLPFANGASYLWVAFSQKE